MHPGGRTIEADRIIALPALHGPELAGLPQDGNGFIPIDEFGAVRGVEAVWAAGDATDYPVKTGGVAAQLADTVACAIAARAGADCRPEPFAPELQGYLLTGGRPRHIRGRAGGGEDDSELTEVERGHRPEKIVARYLSPASKRRASRCLVAGPAPAADDPSRTGGRRASLADLLIGSRPSRRVCQL